MKFDAKKNQGFLITLGVLVGLAVVALILWRSAASGAREARAAIESARAGYEVLVRKYGGEPDQGLVKQYKEKLEQMKRDAAAMGTAVPESGLPSYTPASFKDELRLLRDKYQAESQATGILIPEDIGFGPYLGTEMPKAGEMARLTSQLTIVRDVLEILLSNKVISVTTIDRNPQGMVTEEVVEDVDVEGMDQGPAPRLAKTAEESALKARSLYEAVPVMFQFRIKPGQLYPILAAIRNSGHFYRIARLKCTLDVQALGEIKDPAGVTEELAVDLVVEHIILRKEALAGTSK
ncbi:MAG: Amuc_1100 family pilus-like protein [bacterium]|nr:Amuc_1100 family pilus-like protein [bacterium]